MGNFQFVTLFPGGYGRNAPHISLRVSHPDFSTIDSAMYFRGDRRNSSDPRLRALSQSSQDLLMSDVTMRDINYPAAGLQSTYNIVLRGKTHYRNY
jgi:protocatechuate 3,4-dioxygenase beta subunit